MYRGHRVVVDGVVFQQNDDDDGKACYLWCVRMLLLLLLLLSLSLSLSLLLLLAMSRLLS